MKKIVIIILLSCYNLCAQSFLNGSFEYNHFNRCDSINISNSVFNSLVDNVYGIGILQSLDFFHDSCLVITAEDGDYFSSLETGSQDTNSTAISFLLSQPILVLDTYIVSFYDKSTNNISQFEPIKIEIGYSNNNSTVGTIVYTSPVPDTVWNKRFVFITPLVNAQYITAKGVSGTNDHFTIIDNFSFDTTGLYLAIEKEQHVSFSVYPNPCNEELHVQLQGYVAKAREIKIYNVLGDVVLSKKINVVINTSEVVLDVSNLSSGVYVAVLDGEQSKVVKKIIKE